MTRNASSLPLEVEVATVEAVAEGVSVAEEVAEAEEAEAVATWVANQVEKVSKATLLLDPMDQKIGRP